MECTRASSTWIFVRWCVHLYICVCVILMMPSSASLLGCQHGAGDCHTHRPPSKSCWDRSFFSVRTDDSHWHQIDPGHVELIILCLHVVCLIQKYKSTCARRLELKTYSASRCFVIISPIKLYCEGVCASVRKLVGTSHKSWAPWSWFFSCSAVYGV